MLSIFDDNLLIARPIPNGYTYTLASRLGHMLSLAEAEYGPRDKSFTILGIEFRQGVPQIWFPGNCGNVVVQLGIEASQDIQKAMFQLSHEAVHLLDPSSEATTLEEGIATDFSLSYMAKTMGNPHYNTGDARYDNAVALVRTMLKTKPDAPKLLRQAFGPFRKITASQITQTCPGLAANIADQLAAPF